MIIKSHIKLLTLYRDVIIIHIFKQNIYQSELLEAQNLFKVNSQHNKHHEFQFAKTLLIFFWDTFITNNIKTKNNQLIPYRNGQSMLRTILKRYRQDTRVKSIICIFYFPLSFRYMLILFLFFVLGVLTSSILYLKKYLNQVWRSLLYALFLFPICVELCLNILLVIQISYGEKICEQFVVIVALV